MSVERVVGAPHQRRAIGTLLGEGCRTTPERRLLCAMLEAAWSDPLLDPAWLASDAMRPMSFAWICEALGLDVEAVRKVWPKGKPGTVHGARWRRG